MVIHMAFLLSFVDLLQPCGDRVSRFIYSIHIYHWLIQQYNDTCCFVLFASEIANKLFHIRKEILWYRRGFLLCSFFFSVAVGLVVRLTSWARGPEALMRMSEKHLCRCCAVEENPCGFHSFEPINLLRAQCGKKSPQKKSLQGPQGSLWLCQKMPAGLQSVLLVPSLREDNMRQFSVLSIWHFSSPHNLFVNPKQIIHKSFHGLNKK